MDGGCDGVKTCDRRTPEEIGPTVVDEIVFWGVKYTFLVGSTG